MNIGRLFARLSIYRASRRAPLWALVALAVGFYLLAGIGKAHASQFDGVDCGTSYKRATESEAAYCGDKRAQALTSSTTDGRLVIRFTSTYHQVQTKSKTSETWGADSNWSWYETCPEGTQPDPEDDFNCVDPAEKCLAKPALGPGIVTGGVGTACYQGCVFDIAGSNDSVHVGLGDPPVWLVTGHEPTGATCSTDDYTPTTDPQQCTPAGSGQTFCVQPDGKHCYSASTGRQICWRPGETGEKTDKNFTQTRDGGTTPATPTTPDTTQSGDPVTTTSTVGPDGTTITTTTTNYTTNDNTDAGTNNDGEAGDGTESGSSSGDGSAAMEQLGEEAANLDTGEGGEGIDGDTAWGVDDTGTFTADESGFGLTRTCPPPPEVAGITMDFAALCQIMGYIGLLVLAAAHMHALYIIAGD